MNATPDGVLAVDKPSGWTSFDVVAVARRALAVRRVGHGGTLDPLATGLLPILIGRGTKFADTLHTAPKVYAAIVAFGAETTTDDREGAPTRTAPVPADREGDLDAALEAFRGAIAQVPPAFAAVRVGGRHAYDRARAGEALTLAPRTVTIERLAIAGWDPPHLRLLVVCSTGTYIRALARDLGRARGSAAHLAGLRRLAVGGLEVAAAVPVEVLRAGAAELPIRPADDRILGLAERYRSAPAAELLADWGRSS